MLATYEKALHKLYSPEINKLLIDLRQYRDRINAFLDANASTPEMREEEENTNVASTLASCRIDGVSVTEKRMREIIEGTVTPKARKEREAASYRFALNTIDDSYPYIRISTGAICQLHRDLYRYLDVPFAGRWEDGEEASFRKQELGKAATRLATTVLITKQTLLRDACTNYKQAIARKACDPLVAICMFALDVINIHPFAEGVGRLSRLLTLMTMFQNGYFVGDYVSLARQIEKTKPAYVKAIEAGKRVVPEGGNEDDAETDYEPFVVYLLGAMLDCCREFGERHDLGPVVVEKKRTAPDPAAKAEEERKRRQKQLDVDREERLRQRAAMKAHAEAALNNPPRMSKAGEDLLASKEQKVSNAKHAVDLSTTPAAFQQSSSRSSSPWASHGGQSASARAGAAANEPAGTQASPSSRPSEPAPARPRNQRGGTSNEEVVREYFRTLEGSATKKEVVAACPGMSAKTVERMIQKFMAEGYVEKIGAARSTAYRRAR